MTNNEKTRKALRKAFLGNRLLELQRKIIIAREILTRSNDLHKVLKNEYEALDRELFETSPGITIVPEKKAPGEPRVSKTPNVSERPAYDPLDYENMSTEERKRTLTRLLEIQKNQAI